MKRLLSLFLAIGLILGLVACAGDSNQDEVDGADKEELVEDIEVDKGILNVEITIPASLAEGMSEEDVKEEVAEHGYKSGRKNSDGSVTYSMSKSKHKELLKEFDKAFQELVDELLEDEDNSFTDIKYTKDFTDITILVDSEKYSDWDSIYVFGLFMYSGFYQAFDGVSDNDMALEVRMIDENGKEHYNYSFEDDFMGIVEDDDLLEEEALFDEMDLNTARELKDGELVSSEDYELELEYSEITEDVLPAEPGMFYSHYAAKDGRVYLDLSLVYKNLETIDVDAEEIASAFLIYADQYNYKGFSVVESGDRDDLKQSFMVNISPLSSEYLHFLFELPGEVKSTDAGLTALIYIKDEPYKVLLREGKEEISQDLSEGVTFKESGEIEEGEVIAIEDVAELSLDYVQITDDVMPPEPSDFYTHYEAEAGKVYVDVCFEYKSWLKNPVDAGELLDAKLIYDGQYEYTGFTAVESDNRGSIDSAYGKRFAPLITEHIHYLFEVPEEVEDSSKSLLMEFTLGGGDYSLRIR